MRSKTCRTLTRQLCGTTALTAGLVSALGLPAAMAQSAATTAQQLPTLAVEGRASAPAPEYKTDTPSLPKLTESLRDTPQSITVIPRQIIEDQNATSLRDTLRNTSGISIAAGEAGAQGDNLTIRGFSARNDLYLDGMRDFGSYARDTFAFEQVEVLKGPGSILFGRGSTGGVINQASKTPLLDRFVAGNVTFGTDATKRITGDVNQTIPGLLGTAVRLNVMGHDAEVAGRDVAEVQRWGFAPSIAFGLGTPTRATVSYMHQTQNDLADYGLPWLDRRGSATPTASVAPVRSENFYGFRSDYLKTDADVGTIKLEHDVTDSITLRDQFRVAQYTRRARITEPQVTTFLAPTAPLSAVSVTRNQIQTSSQENFIQNQADATVRFRTGSVGHTVVAGVEAGFESSEPVRTAWAGVPTTSLLTPNENQAFAGRATTSSRTTVNADSVAFYALDTIKLDPQWTLMGGLRYDQFAASVKETIAGTSFQRTDDALSWRAAIAYKPVEIGTVYFAAGTSFNPSAESLALTAATASLPPERNKSYEVGTKWDLMGERLSLTGAIFRLEKENAQVVDPNNSALRILGGNYLSDGFELGMTGRLLEGWNLLASYTHLDTRVASSPRRFEVGNRLANAPDHTFNLFTTYNLPWWDRKLTVGGGVNYVASRFSSVSVDTVGGLYRLLPDYYTVNLMAKYQVTEQVAVQMNAYNLTDELYFDQPHPNHVIPGAARTFLFSTAFKF